MTRRTHMTILLFITTIIQILTARKNIILWQHNVLQTTAHLVFGINFIIAKTSTRLFKNQKQYPHLTYLKSTTYTLYCRM